MLNINQQLLTMEESKIKQFNDLARIKNAKYILSIGEPFFETPLAIKKACFNALKNNYTHYSPADGYEDVKQKIISFENVNHCTKYKTDNVLITNGSTDAITSTLLTILNEEDEVIVLLPAYNLYHQICKFFKAKVININTELDNFQIDYQKLASVITSKTKALIINSPNNPTGIIYDEKSQTNLINLMKKYHFWLIIDSVYEQINFSHNTLHRLFNDETLIDRIIICQSFSKSYAMTGWRIGYIIGNNHLVKQITKLHQILTVSTNSFIQKTLIATLDFDNSKMISKYQKNSEYAYKRLLSMGLEVIKPMGGFYLFPSIKKYSTDSWAFCVEFLKKYQTAILPGICFGLDGYVRISICSDFKSLKEALDNLENYLKNL